MSCGFLQRVFAEPMKERRKHLDGWVKICQGQHNGKKRSKDILRTWQGLVEALDHGVLPEE